ncbi:MAG: AI-2E family transporter [Steroidobacteraceae bacterium]
MDAVSAKLGMAAKWAMEQDFYRKALILATVAVLGIGVYRVLEPFWGALAWAICLAFLLGPLQVRLARRLRGRAGLAAGLLTVLTPLIVLGPLALLGFAFAGQVALLVERLQKLQLHFDASLLAQLEAAPLIGPAVHWLRENVPVSAAQVHDGLLGAAQAALKGLAAAGGNVALGAVGSLVGFFLMLFLLFFLLRDGPAMLARAVRLIPLAAQRREALLRLVGSTTRAVAYGTVLTALAQGALVAIGFAIAGLPSPVVFGVLAAVLALLPAGGAAIVWVPAVLWLFAAGSWGWAIFLAIWGVGVTLSDNLLRPLIIQSHAPVSTLAVFVGVIGGVSAFGAIGLVAGPVLLTLVADLLRFADENAAI